MSFIAGYLLGLGDGGGSGSLAQRLADTPTDYTVDLSSNYHAEFFTDFDNVVGLNVPSVQLSTRSTPERELYYYFLTMYAKTYMKIYRGDSFLFGFGAYQDTPLGSGGVHEKLWYFPPDGPKYLTGEATVHEIRDKNAAWRNPTYLGDSWTLTYSPTIHIRMTYYDTDGTVSSESDYSNTETTYWQQYTQSSTVIISDLGDTEYAKEIEKFNEDIYKNPVV